MWKAHPCRQPTSAFWQLCFPPPLLLLLLHTDDRRMDPFTLTATIVRLSEVRSLTCGSVLIGVAFQVKVSATCLTAVNSLRDITNAYKDAPIYIISLSAEITVVNAS